MNSKFLRRTSKGFTLVELLIVVIIVAILAAIVVPQFGDSSTEAKEAALDANLAAMRSAIELYKVQHKGNYPGTTSSSGGCANNTGTITISDTSTAADRAQALIEQLTYWTNGDGAVCKVADSNYKYGPYLRAMPKEPINNKGNVNTEIAVTATGAAIVPTVTTGGWAYDTKSGQIVMNSNADDSSKTRKYYQH